jgi:hypothetical protein
VMRCNIYYRDAFFEAALKRLDDSFARKKDVGSPWEMSQSRGMNQLNSIVNGFLFGVGLILANAAMEVLFHMHL